MKPADLPFLVVHARIAWPIALALATALVATAWFVLRTRYRRWSTTSRARWRIAMAEPVDTGTRMLRGVLRGGAAVSGERNTGLWLDCDGVRVNITATLDVVEGSSESLDANRLADGDRVLVQGAVRRDGEHWIIDAPVVHGAEWWKGERAGARRADKISGWAESPSVSRTTRVSRAVIVIASAAIAYGGFRLTGHLALESLRHSDYFEEPSAIGALSFATLVAATHDDALAQYKSDLRDRFARTETEVSYQLALAELQRDCGDEVEILIAAGYWEQARQYAHHCRNQDVLKTALLTGRFEDLASSTLPYWRGFAAIVAHDWAQASNLADELASKYPGEKTACLREYLHKKSGAHFASDAMLTCDVVRAAEGLDLTREVPSLSADVLRAAATGCADEWPPHDRYYALSLGYLEPDDGVAWLGILCPPSTSLMSLYMRTQIELMRGTSGAITRELDEDMRASGGRIRQKIAALRALVALRTAAEVPYDEDLDLDIGGHPSALRSGHGFESEDRNADPLRAAASGNGGPLADRLRQCDSECPSQLDLISVLPRIHTNRGAVLGALRIRWLWTGYRSIASPFVASRYAGFERDIARLTGDAEAEHRWQAIVDRHASVYGAKDVLVALLIWQDLLD